MRNDDFVSDGFLALVGVVLVVLRSSLLAIRIYVIWARAPPSPLLVRMRTAISRGSGLFRAQPIGRLPPRSRRASMAHTRRCKQAQPGRTSAGPILGEKQ